MSITIEKRIGKVKDWLIMNSASVPYIVAYGLRQWTDGVYKRYPENYLASFMGGHIIKGGSEAQGIADREEYLNSFKRIINNRDILEKLYSDFLVDEKNFKKFIDLIKKNGEEYLHKNYDKFINVYDAEYISAAAVDGVLVYGERFFAEMMSKYPKYEKELRILTTPYGETFFNRYHRSLLKIAIKYKGNKFSSVAEILDNSKIKSDLDKIQQQFHWIKNNYKNVSALPVSFFAEQLLEIIHKSRDGYKKEYKELCDYENSHKKDCTEIKKRKIFDSEDFDKLLWLGKIAWWVDRRKEYNLIANHYIGKHLEWLCNKYGFIYDDVSFLLPWELDDVISGKKKITDFPIKERKTECIYIRDIYGKELFLIGKKAKSLWLKINPPVRKVGGDDMKGMVAYRGKARGIVRIVMDTHNYSEFNDGDILVTGMTRPDFLSLMKKAAAFVTDEGGITCHAAIIAREMKKPCIIGTKIATQILKNGDFVEVDANNGIVKIIK